MIKITHLTSAHVRYDIRIFIKECCSLAKIKNYEVNLIVADNKGDEVKNNVNIIDIGKLQGRMNRIFKTTHKVFNKAIELDSDIYHFHDPELIPIGLKLKKLGKKVIFDIHENMDLQILEKQWIPFILRKFISKTYWIYEKKSCKKFDLLVVPQEAMLNKYLEINKTVVIGNFPNKQKKINNKFLSKYKLLYSGAITEARGLWNMLDLILELNKISKNYSLTIAGKIEKSLLHELKKHTAWKKINYLGFLSQEELLKIYHEHNIGLILLNNVGQYYMAYSLKLFEYMQNGMTVIMPNFGDWLSFNKKFNVGFNEDVQDSKTIAKRIESISSKQMIYFYKNNIKLVEDVFSWESQERKLYQLYEDVINVNKI